MEDNFIKCRDGKEREIFPALIKDTERIRHYVPLFNADMIMLNMLTPDTEKVSKAAREGIELKTEEMFADEAMDAIMEVMVMAFGHKYTADEIAEWLDVSMVGKILEIFFDVSGYKKKAKLTLPAQVGQN